MCYKCNAMTSVISTSVGQPSVEATQRDFATSRVRIIRNDHIEKLRKQFFLDSEDSPRTAEDLIKAIKDDDFTLDQKKIDRMKEDGDMFYNAFYGIRWGKNKPDRDGFDVAYKALEAETQNVIDTVTLGTVEEARQALEAFKTWTLPTSTTAA